MQQEKDPDCNSGLIGHFEKIDYPEETLVTDGTSAVDDLPSGANVDIVQATQYGKFDVVRKMIESGRTDVNHLDKEGISLLHWAAINNRISIVRYLIMKGAIIDRKCGDLNTNALQWAIRQGHLQMVVLLLHYGSSPLVTDVNGLNSLHVASQSGHTPIVAYLIATGACDVDCTDEQNGRTALMHAILHSAGEDPTRLLINLGASVNKTDKSFGNTALHYALGTNNYSAVTKLLNCNASLDIPNKKGESVKSALKTVTNIVMKKRIEKHIQVTELTSRRNWRTFHKNPKTIDKMTFTLPFVCMGLIGLLLESYLHFMLKLILIPVVILTAKYISGSCLTLNSVQILPFSTYLAQKVLMYFTWFHYYWNEVSGKTNLILLFLSFFLCYNFYKTVFSDPGYLKRSMEAKKQAIISYVESDQADFSSFCTTCIIRRPIRSKHCVFCNQCVARMDHHCPWVFNCVAANNHSYFINFLFFLEAIITLFLGATTVYMWHYLHGTLSKDLGPDISIFGGLFGYREAPNLILSVGSDSVDLQSGSPVAKLGWFYASVKACIDNQWILFISTLSLFYWIWVGALFVSQCYQMFCIGMTTNEFLNRHRYKHFKPDADASTPTSECQQTQQQLKSGQGQSARMRQDASHSSHMHSHDRFNMCRPNKTYSPFANGVLQNVSDFYQMSLCGLIKPSSVDWTNVFSVEEVNNPNLRSRDPSFRV